MIHPVVCNPVLWPLVWVKDPVRWLAGLGYPSGAILHFDADIDAFSEQTGGPHTFNHAILSPQYQRNADGSYTDVGAKPAVDVLDGEKWLRSCGAVTNLLPSGAEDISRWETNACTVSPEGSFYRLTATATSYSFVRKIISAPTVGQHYTVSRRVKRGSLGFCTIGFHGHPNAYFNLDDLTYSFTDTGAVGASITDDGDGWRIISATWQYQGGKTYAVYFALASAFGSQSNILVGDHIYMSNPQLTATSYPVPYIPPGTTMPASNATTTNGMWFALPDGSPLWKALTGSPLTLATRVRMGVGSGDIAVETYYRILDCLAQLGINGVQFYGRTAGGGRVLYASDNSTIVRCDGEWPRNTIITRVTQVNTAGTQYRVGYMIEGTHPTIQWGSWTAYDGSFGPSTLYRLMLGYNNAYPMWFSRITAWKEQVSDDRILEALNG